MWSWYGFFCHPMILIQVGFIIRLAVFLLGPYIVVFVTHRRNNHVTIPQRRTISSGGEVKGQRGKIPADLT